jgi:alkylation response protein AidB-like acyl-CoA dehydrogenase
MNFDLSSEQQELRDSIAAVLEKECPPSLARTMYEDDAAVPEQPWQSACELGWTALLVPEQYGGLALGPVELGLLAEEHGRHLATGPCLATLSQLIPALSIAGNEEQKSQLLPRAAEGEVTGCLAVAGPAGDFSGRDASLVAKKNAGDGGWTLSGSRHFVFDCSLAARNKADHERAVADEVVVAAHVDEGDGVGLFLVPGAELAPHRSHQLDVSRPLCRLDFDRVDVAPERVLASPGASAKLLANLLQHATVALAFEMVGTCQALFDVSLEYAKEREQFGRPIGSFQAIQHKFADLFIALEQARATASYAAMTLAEDDPGSELATSMAKASVGACQRMLGKEGIQIHGGLGYTWEQDVHLYVKRLKTGEALFGTTAHHRQRIAALLGV